MYFSSTYWICIRGYPYNFIIDSFSFHNFKSFRLSDCYLSENTSITYIQAVYGWMPKLIAENIVWNSTANLKGKPGANIPLDLLNEFLNNEFKTNLKRVKGQYTDNAVQMCSLISGTVGKRLEEKFMSQIIDKYVGKSNTKKCSQKRDLKKFVKMYSGEKLFHCVPGRHHSAYENFVHHIPVNQQGKLKERLTRYGVKLDTEQEE
ncbi:hypothetical protein MAR_028968 [Mya arenaria]|uniref:Uncharacterized protein n=1 Tax=Mya arenaria TaxID=6604 RepID=A0ABY7DH73_MYAAR|nr:hypothetical protein MAR_028968 [Mya arenaria]